MPETTDIPSGYHRDERGTVWPDDCTCGGEIDAPCPVCKPATEIARLSAELATMTAVAKSNKRVTEGYAQELDKALRLLGEARQYGNLSAGLRRRVDTFVEVNEAAAFPATPVQVRP